MSIAQTIVASNQTFIDKVLKENEDLITECANLKQEIAKIQMDINKIKAETFKTVEPKIKQLIIKNKEEFEKQEKELKPEMEKHLQQCKMENEKLKNEWKIKIDNAENIRKGKIEKMKMTASNREHELKDAISQKLSLIPLKVEKAKTKIEKEENGFRYGWEKIIMEKLYKEYQANSKNEYNNLKMNQENYLINIVNQLESKTHDDAKLIEAKIDKETQEHHILINKLNDKLNVIEKELSELKSDEDQYLQLEKNIEELQEKIEKCRCSYYQEEIQRQNRAIIEIEENIEKQQQQYLSTENQNEYNINDINFQIKNEINKNKELIYDIQKLENELAQSRSETNNKISELEQQHKKQISLISERVKQTVFKKDQIIMQLKDRISKFHL